MARDIFNRDMEHGSLSYTYGAKSDIHRLDGGGVLDLQYILLKGKGIRLNLQMAWGFSNLYKPEGETGRSRQILLGAGIPIGHK